MLSQTSKLKRVFLCALSGGVPLRSFYVALVVGTILNLINQGDVLSVKGGDNCRAKGINKPVDDLGRNKAMAVINEKTVVTQRIHGDCPTHSRTEISTRDVKTIVDEPKERHGTNMAPTPTETVVAALIACTNVIGHKCAHKHGVKIAVMSIDAEALFDRRGTQLLEEIEIPFPKIRLVINLTTSANEADLSKVKADLHRYCPVAKLIRNAGTEIEEVWNVTNG